MTLIAGVGDFGLTELKDEAIAAKNAAQTAETGAVAAKNSAETASSAAVNAADAAEAAETGAVAAKNSAETASSAAVNAADAAEAAQTSAVAAKNSAETASSAAVTAKNAAQTAETGAVAAKNSAETASSAAVTAKNAAQTAETGAVAAKTDAQNLVAGALIGTPKGVYTSLSALNTANPDHAFIYLTTDNGHWNYWNGTAFSSGGTYQAPLSVVQETGTSTSNVMSQKTVSDIIGNDYASKYTVTDKFVWGSNGAIQTNTDYDATDYLPCTPSDLIVVRLPDNSIAGYAFLNSSYVYISGGTGNGLANAKSYLTPPAGAAFFRVCKLKVDSTFLTIFKKDSLYNQAKEDFPKPVQNTGISTTDTISQKVVTDIIGDDLSAKYTSTGFYIRASSGTRETNASYDATDYLPCTPTYIFIAQLPDNATAGYAFYNSSNVYISGGTGDGLSNAKIFITPPTNTAYIRICKLSADPSFLAKYSEKSNVQALRSTPTPQVDLLNGKASTFNLASELASKDIVIVPAGTWNVPTTISIPSGKKIYGVRGKSILQASGGNTKVFSIVSKSDISISGLTIKGESGVVDYADTSKVSNKEQALAENGAGTKYGIYIESSRDIVIDDIEVKYFDYCGIYVKTLAQNYMNGITISSGYINNNYIGLKLADGSEYSVYSNLHINTNHIGLVIESANNNVQLSSITRNVFGAVIKPVGYNTGHGSLSNCALNHNTVMALYINSIDSGYLIDACNFHYPETNTIYMKNSSGIIISSMNLYGLVTVEGGGGNMIVSSNFRILASTVTLSGTTHLSLKNNIYVDGSSPNSINN